jgi:hypothetical protein
MQLIVGAVLTVVISGLLVVLGVEALRWFLVDFSRLYADLSLTDACLIILITLQVGTLLHLLVSQWRAAPKAAAHPAPQRALYPRPAATGSGPRTQQGTRGRSTSGSPRSGQRRQPPHPL